MYTRLIKKPLLQNMSFFLFGPRGTGKTYWLKKNLPSALYIDLLHDETFMSLQINPSRLENLIPPKWNDWIIIDEVQKIPAILDEVHRLIESKKYRFVLTGSSARKLKQKGVNLLAGRALTYHLYPLTKPELGSDFNFEHSLNHGNLPMTFQTEDPSAYLASYVSTYLKEEVQQEALVRHIPTFHKFLEIASFSQGSLINYSAIARELGINRKTVESYFDILEDLLIAYRVSPFTKRAKRGLVRHSKFYFFDNGLYRKVRPTGPFDQPEEISGMALETLFLQEAIALNEYYEAGYEIFFWRTQRDQEVDFVLYGKEKVFAFEIKRAKKIQRKDFRHLKTFQSDYDIAECYLVFGGNQKEYHQDITAIPFVEAIDLIHKIMSEKLA